MIGWGIDAVVFDLFGTLVPNIRLERWWRNADATADLLGAPREGLREQLRASFLHRMDGTLRDGPELFEALLAPLGVRAPRAALEEADRLRSEFLLSCLEPKPEAVACLEALRARGLRLALASDCSSETAEHLDKTPFGAYFEVRALSAVLGVTKPDEKVYHHVLEGLEVSGDRCLYVGDGNSEELPGAKRHGMTTVWVDNGTAQEWEHRYVPGGDHTVRDLREILAIL